MKIALKVLAILLVVGCLGFVGYQVAIHSQTPPETEGTSESGEETGNTQTSEAPEEIYCTLNFDPVCGTVDGVEKTFGNECEAEKAGATKIEEGLCSPMEACPTEKDPVCGMLEEEKRNFDNLCIAEAAGATDIQDGLCAIEPAPVDPNLTTQSSVEVTPCPERPDPVCALLEGKKTDFANTCTAQALGATEITAGTCPVEAAPEDLQTTPAQ